METKTIVVEVESNLGSLKSQLKEAQAEVAAMSEKFGATSTEAMNAAKAAGRLKDTIGDAKALTDSFNPDAKFKALTASMSGALNGFQAVEGAMGLFGAEGVEVQKMLLKVQSAMALTQGVDGLLEAKDAFKTFGAQASAALAKTTAGQYLLTAAQTAGAVAMKIVNAVMNANPILLIVTGITALVGAFYLLVSSQKAAEETTASLNKTLEKQQNIINRQSKQIDDFSKLDIANARERGASEEELTKIKEQAANDQIALAYKNYISTQKTYDKISALRKKDQATSEEVLEAQKKEQSSYNAWLDAMTSKNISDAEGAADKAEDAREKQAAAEEKRKQKATANAEKLKAEKQKTYEEEVALDKKRREDLLAEDLFYESESEKGYEREKQGIADSNKLKEEARIAELEGISFANKVKEEKRIEDEAADKKAQEEKLARNKQIASLSLDVAKSGLQGISDIVGAFAGKSKAAQKKAFATQKKLNIAIATIDTIKGAVSAFTGMTSTIPGPVGIALGVVAAAGVAASGVAQVKKITSTKFDGGGDEGGGGGGGGDLSSSAPAAPTPANFNVVGNSGTNQLMQGLQNQPIKAYVVGGDVTTAQNLDRNKITTASI